MCLILEVILKILFMFEKMEFDFLLRFFIFRGKKWGFGVFRGSENVDSNIVFVLNIFEKFWEK